MSSKFAALAANVSDAFNMPVIHQHTDAVLKDKAGKEAYVALLSIDSDAGRAIDRAHNLAQMRSARSGRNLKDNTDFTEQQIEQLVALTVGWHLVDLEGNPIDVPFSPENARELWNDPGMAWLRKQAWVFVNTAGNFIKGSSKISAASPKPNLQTGEN